MEQQGSSTGWWQHPAKKKEEEEKEKTLGFGFDFDPGSDFHLSLSLFLFLFLDLTSQFVYLIPNFSLPLLEAQLQASK